MRTRSALLSARRAARSALALCVSLPLGLALVGCGHDGRTTAGTLTCATEARGLTYAPGMTQSSGATLSVTLVTSTPGPPVKGDNTWEIEVRDASGPVDGATITVTPFMPDHGHGTSIRAVVTPTGTPGRYRLSPVNLSMAGLWQVTLAVRGAGGATLGSVVFSFCVEG